MVGLTFVQTAALKWKMRYEMNLMELKKAMWIIIVAEKIEVTNQNIDWLLERAYKLQCELTQEITEGEK